MPDRTGANLGFGFYRRTPATADRAPGCTRFIRGRLIVFPRWRDDIARLAGDLTRFARHRCLTRSRPLPPSFSAHTCQAIHKPDRTGSWRLSNELAQLTMPLRRRGALGSRRERRWPRNRWLMWATRCVLLYAVSLAGWTIGRALSDHSRDGTGFACLHPRRRPR